MAILSPVFSPYSSIVGNSNTILSLANNMGFVSGPLDINVERACDVVVGVEIYSPNAVVGSGYLGIGVLPSFDGTLFSGASLATSMSGSLPISANTLEAYISYQRIVEVPAIQSTMVWTGTLSRYIGTLPPYLAIVVVNRTGGALDAAFISKVNVSFVTYEYV